MTNTFTHWDKIYQSKNHEQLSWHQDRASISLDWILEYTHKDTAILDVGSGVSILADNLLDADYCHLSLLEISLNATQIMKKRLKKRLDCVTFYNENILRFESATQFDCWHDRAVFHFLTAVKDQEIYLKKLRQQLKSGGYFLLSTFALTGPKQCSKLDIVQYDIDKITLLLGDDFKLIKSASESHPHPNGNTQDFNYFLFQKR